jgi:5-methylcytosine-specific restriction endonuclease McrA
MQCNWEDKVITDDGHTIVGKSYPSIEHVIPLSKGGKHSWNNVKLACMECNTLKGDKIINIKGKKAIV